MTSVRLHLARVLIVALSGGCTAELSGGDTGTTATPAAGSSGAGGINSGETWAPGKQADPTAASMLPLRMLTRAELNATLSLIFEQEFGLSLGQLRAADVLPGESPDLSGFLSVGEVTEVNVLRYMDAASSVAASVAPSLATLMNCDIATATDEAACVSKFVSVFGELLYRRPLSIEEVAEHVTFFQHERTVLGADATSAALQLLKAMLQAPFFLYRWEEGWKVADRSGGAARLNAYQVASRLAFFLWGSGPDRALLTQARSGLLDKNEQVISTARAMLDSPRAQQALDSFHSQWLGLSSLDTLFKDEARFPEWNEDLRASMQQEVKTFTRQVLLDGDATVSSLLGAPYSFLNESLANLYGVPGIKGPELRRVDLNPAQRAGLLTMPAILAAAAEPSVANPFKRGKLILEKLLCRQLEPPPNVPALPVPDPKNPQPEREVLEALTSGAPCVTCHTLINPLGFGLGNFDALGKFQTQDELGFPIDATGVLPTGETFSNPSELAAALSRSEEVRSCVAKQWFRFGFGRAETSSDAFSLNSAYDSFSAANFNIKELLAALVGTRSFLYRQLEDGEVLP